MCRETKKHESGIFTQRPTWLLSLLRSPDGLRHKQLPPLLLLLLSLLLWR